MNQYKATYKINHKILGERIYKYDFNSLDKIESFFYNMFIGDFKTQTKLYHIDDLEKIDIMNIEKILKMLGINLRHIEITINENYYRIYNKDTNSLMELNII